MLRSLTVRAAPRDGFPFDIPALRAGTVVPLNRPVTILAGENGSGKSTLLEALAVLAELPALGSAQVAQDRTLAGPTELANVLRPAWSPRLRRGFFLRAEDVFGYVLKIRAEMKQLARDLKEAEQRLEGASPHALALGTGPYRASIGALRARYGENPDARSHGETFLHLFRERIVPGGLYLMDEPEAALSPQSQLALVALMHDAVRQGSQFVIATHSPLLQAVPGAGILLFEDGPLREATWEDLPSVQLWRRILQEPAAWLRHVWPEDVGSSEGAAD